MTTLTVAFDSRVPYARWGPLFQVFCLEQPDVALDWRAVGFPTSEHGLLKGADVGLFLHPPHDEGLRGLVLDASPMLVVMAVGHPLAECHELEIADILDEPFPGGPNLHPEWCAFWTLDAHRGAPARRTGDDVRCMEQGLDVVASGRAIVTVPGWVAQGLAHPGVVALPLRDGPEQVTTRLVWRAGDDNAAVLSLVELAAAWTSDGRANGREPR